jgi:hypothetical protein
MGGHPRDPKSHLDHNPRNLIETEEERVRREILKREKKGENISIVGRT